jgi:LPS O-antigen subunit length determinant protein (WzzB/FepE family)
MIDLRFSGEELTAETAGTAPAISMIEVLTELALGKWLIAKVVLAAVVAGILLSVLLPVRYTAITRIMPPQQAVPSAAMFMNQMANSGTGSLAAAAGMGLGLKNPNDIYIGLLNSRPIADAIIHQFDLAKLYRAKDMTAARKKLAEVTVVVSEKNGFIAVSVTDQDRKRSAAMANAYTNELRLLTKTLAVTEASQRRLFYEDQLKQAKDALLAAELSFQQIQQSKGLVALDAQAKAMIESLALLRAQVAAREVEVQALRSYSTERNPDLLLAERELSSLKEEAARLEQRSHLPGSAVLGLGDVPGAGMEYLRAEHELKYRQAMFDLLLKQYDAAKLDESKDAAIIQVVEPAIEPDRKSSPKRSLVVSIFAVVGFLAGALPVLFSWWKRSVQSDPRIAKQIGDLRRAIKGRTEPV